MFSIISFGNAEFMVMIPVLFFILLAIQFNGIERFMLRVMIGLMIWNIAFGIIPLNINSQATEQFLCDQSLSEKRPLIIPSDDQLLISMVYYRTGKSKADNVLKSPAILKGKGEDTKKLEYSIDSAFVAGTSVYTDCTGQKIISRASILEENVNRDFFNNYKTTEVYRRKSIFGEKIVSSIDSRK
jgi:hypothetical protein